MAMRMAFFFGVAIAAAFGCGGSAQQQQEQRDAAVVAGIAATLTAVQTARAQAPANQGSPIRQCCAVCGPCDFPCGDACVPNGTMCTDPPGCACTDAKEEGVDRPLEPAPSAGCPGATPGIVVTAE